VGEPVFREARTPTRDELQGLLDKIIARLMNCSPARGTLLDEQCMIYLTDIGPDHELPCKRARIGIAFWPARRTQVP